MPLVHSMHTMAKVKNDALADGDTPEPLARVIGEEQVVEAADMLIANTDLEAKQLIELYDADPGRVEVVHPGVDLDVFRPVAKAAGPRRRSACPADADVLLFAGRIQPLKAPDVLLRAVAELLEREPDRRARDWSSPSSAGPSGSGLDKPQALADLAAELGHRPTSSGSCRRSRRTSWPGGTPPRRWSPCRPTTSRSAWSPPRRRPPAPRSSRPRSAA